MKFNIYDYQNKPTRIDTGDREIEYIDVHVISGDEVVDIHFNGGAWRRDSSKGRLIDFNDAHYRVEKENIEEWIKKASAGGDIAYSRIPD